MGGGGGGGVNGGVDHCIEHETIILRSHAYRINALHLNWVKLSFIFNFCIDPLTYIMHIIYILNNKIVISV